MKPSLFRAKKRDRVDLSTGDDNADDNENFDLNDQSEPTNNPYNDELMDLPQEEIDANTDTNLAQDFGQVSVDASTGFTRSTLPDYIIDSIYDDYVDVDDEKFDDFAQYVLQKKLGKKSFRPLQLDIIKSILRGEDNLGIMGTGYGKSAIFQILGYLVPGPSAVLVISPMVALIEDQMRELTNLCIPATKLA
ncbi:unnamed protein product [Oikopleura dioica]|uniref:DEAD/DEAH-box helicase domain-containing protein n=1 Tax=Oikopleura dioica TaxID=34765 RepID=E4YM96_OIKDI|nr:unnamed protein product [Oikopleura dioica]